VSRIRQVARALALTPPEIPPEILAAIFSAASESGLTIQQAFHVMSTVADTIDPELSGEIKRVAARLDVSVDRRRTYAAMAAETSSPLLARLLATLGNAEDSGEDLVQRSSLIFEARRAEVYPLIMIVFMVLFFIPAIIVLLVGPLYVSLMQVLNGI
jgi:pilus assembly protein TadC